jgi:ankyrin repeat protein
MIINSNDSVYGRILSIKSLDLLFGETIDQFSVYEHCTPEYYLKNREKMSAYKYGFGKNKKMIKFLSKLDVYESLLDAKIKAGKNIKKYSKYTNDTNNCFIEACKVDNIKNVKHFLEKGISAKSYIVGFITACEHGQCEIVKLLFRKNMDINILNNAFTSACHHGHYDIVHFLYKNGAIINDDDNCLFYSIMSDGHADVVKFLIDKKSNIHLKNDEIISHCIKICNNKIFKLLLDKNFDLKTNDVKFLDLCIRYDNVHVFKYLMQNGADNLLTYRGKNIYDNPFIVSVIRGNINIVKFLVKYKMVDIHIDDDIAIKSASEHHNKKIIRILIKSDLDYFSNNLHIKSIVSMYKMDEFYQKFGIRK